MGNQFSTPKDPEVSQDTRIHDKCMGNIVAPKGHQVILISPRNCKATESIHVASDETEDTGTYWEETRRHLNVMASKLYSGESAEHGATNKRPNN